MVKDQPSAKAAITATVKKQAHVLNINPIKISHFQLYILNKMSAFTMTQQKVHHRNDKAPK